MEKPRTNRRRREQPQPTEQPRLYAPPPPPPEMGDKPDPEKTDTPRGVAHLDYYL